MSKEDLMAMSVEEISAMLEENGGEEAGYVMVRRVTWVWPGAYKF